jgi:hypothetical protein
LVEVASALPGEASSRTVIPAIHTPPRHSSAPRRAFNAVAPDSLGERLEIESESPLLPAQADRPELRGVFVNPVSFDTEHPGHCGSIDQTNGRSSELSAAVIRSCLLE